MILFLIKLLSIMLCNVLPVIVDSPHEKLSILESVKSAKDHATAYYWDMYGAVQKLTEGENS